MDDKIRALRDEITGQVIEALETGKLAPWMKPWSADCAPRNAVTGRRYQVGNAIWLGLLGIVKFPGGDPRWVTFAQAKEKGWKVKKGSKGTHIAFWERRLKPQLGPDGAPILEADGAPKMISYSVGKAYTVFHASQIEGIPAFVPAGGNEIERIEAAERIMADSGADIRYGGDMAFYTRDGDFIGLPRPESFKSAADFYATALHELAHWTGHKSRLDRLTGASQGSKEYAREELIAEMASMFLSVETGIPQSPEHFEQHAAYVKHWIEILKEDPDALFKAATEASKVADHLLKSERERNGEKEAAA